MAVSDLPESTAQPRVWKVGALAKLTGLTVRALHHYDHIGLLMPSHRSSSGHRLYTGDDVARLYRICLLRRLGFALSRIGEVLDDPQWQLRDAVKAHLDDTRRRAGVAASLQSRLSRMVSSLAGSDDLSTAELFATMEEMTMLDSIAHSTTALLVYDDIAAAHEYLVRVFGLTPGRLQQDDQGRYVHGEVCAGDHVIWLHPSADEYKSPESLGAATGMTVINVDDADAHYRRCTAVGAQVIEEPTDQAMACGSGVPAIWRANCGSSTRLSRNAACTVFHCTRLIAQAKPIPLGCSQLAGRGIAGVGETVGR